MLVRNDDYWDADNIPMEVERVVFTPIASAATRVAALLSGELDLILYPPVQDLQRLEQSPDIQVKSTPENRTIFLGLNQGADDLDSDSVEGQNPLADKRASARPSLGIDDAIQRVVMRGQSVPAGSIAPIYITGYQEEFDQRPDRDLDRARELLAEAGYEDGFSIDFACPNDRYNNDEAICQAVVGMLGQAGIEANLRAQTRSLHFQQLQNGELDFYMLGWGVPTFDSEYIFNFLYHTNDGERGSWNMTGFSNERMDELVQAMSGETDLDARDELIAEAWEIALDDLTYIPLHHEVLNWACRPTWIFRFDGHPLVLPVTSIEERAERCGLPPLPPIDAGFLTCAFIVRRVLHHRDARRRLGVLQPVQLRRRPDQQHGRAKPRSSSMTAARRAGLNDPFAVQFARFVGNTVQGNFGISYRLARRSMW